MAKSSGAIPHILNLAPAFEIAEIPLDDGFRLLMNRNESNFSNRV